MAAKQTKMKPRKEAIVIQTGSGWVKVLRFETHGRQLVLSRCVAEQVDAETAIPNVVASLFSKGRFGKVPVVAKRYALLVSIPPPIAVVRPVTAGQTRG